MSDSTEDIPNKKPGEAYTIVLSERRGAARARESGDLHASAFPVPELPDICVCCNQPAHGHRHPYSPWSGRGYARRAIELPLCPECTEHAFANLDPAGFALLPLLPGIVTMGIGMWQESPTLQWIGACVSVFALLVFALWHLSASYRGKVTHHEGIDIDALPGRLRIATRNPELVRSVVAHNRRLIERVH